MNKIIVLLLVMALGLYIVITLRGDVNDIDTTLAVENKGDSNVSTGKPLTQGNEQIVIVEITDARSAEDASYTEEEVIRLLGICGMNEGDDALSMLEDMPFHVSDFSERQRKLYEEFVEKCAVWYKNDQAKKHFDHLVTLDKEGKARVDKALQMFMDKDSEAIKKNIQVAKDVLKGVNDSIHEKSALNFLAKNDYELIGRVAHKIGTENTRYVADAAKNYLQLYRCNQTPYECSVNAPEMVIMCLVEDRFCDKSFHEFLALKMTPNQLDDLYAMARAVEEIMAEGYPF